MTINKRTVITAYFDHKHRRLKLPHSNASSNPNNAVMRAHWNMLANTYGAHYCEVYDTATLEQYAAFRQHFVKGERKIETTAEYVYREYGDPIKRVSVHAFFHDLPIAEE